MGSILNDVKKLLGISEEDNSFDKDIIIHINTVFSVLTQLGVGPEGGFSITDDTACWNDYLGDNAKIEMLKSYMYLKVRILFDPPTNSAVLESSNRMLNELEWRLHLEFN